MGAKQLEGIIYIFDTSFERICRWMDSVDLKLGEHEMKVVLMTTRKVAETIILQVGDYQYTSQLFIRYLEVKIDAQVNFNHQLNDVKTKSSEIRTILYVPKPNVGRPKQKRRSLLLSEATSVFTFGIPIGNMPENPISLPGE